MFLNENARVKSRLDNATVATGDTTGDIIPGDDSTTFAVPMGDGVSGYIGAGDSDWFKVFLVAGQSYTFTLSTDQLFSSAMTLDPYLILLDPGGMLQAVNDDYSGRNSQITVTAQQTGTFFLDASSYYSYQTGNYVLTAAGNNTLAADAGANTLATAQTLSLGGNASAAIDTVGDIDWYKVDLQGGYRYTFTLNAAADPSQLSPILSLMDSTGKLVEIERSGDKSAVITFVAETSATYYLVAGAYGTTTTVATGSYSIAASAGMVATVDTVAEDAATTAFMAVGGSFSSNIDSEFDLDWVGVDLTAGVTYVFEAEGDSASGLNDTFLLLFKDGLPIAVDDDGGANLSSKLVFTAQESGRHYLEVSSFGEAGGYTLSLATTTQPKPTEAIDWGAKLTLADGYVDIYFAPENAVVDGVTSLGWTVEERTQVLAAAATYSTFSTLRFRETTDVAQADFKLAITSIIDSQPEILGYLNAPGMTNAGQGVFARSGYGWGGVVQSGLQAGGVGFLTIIHEIGHGLGLAHPHDNGGHSPIMMGVMGATDSYGLYDLNMGIHTVMTYNDNWPLNPYLLAGYGGGEVYWTGHTSTPMALDAAVIQAKYGADTTANSGNTTFSMLTGPFGQYSLVWDTGGIDTIDAGSYARYYSGVHIDLRPATLEYEFGGGGFLSYAYNGVGGLTIAHGVDIENARGADYGDELIGNDLANLLEGLGGSDTITGGAGNDSLYGADGVDTLIGDDGADTLVAGFGDDFMQGYAGADFLFGEGGHDLLWGGDDTDVIYGQDGIDTLGGDDGNDTLYGGDGDDWLSGGNGADSLLGEAGLDIAAYGASSAGVTADLANTGLNTADAASDIYSLIEGLSGSAFADKLYGDGAGNILHGQAGNDELSGRTGDDTLLGGAGADTLNGGDGIDLAAYDAASSAITVSLASGSFSGEASGDVLIDVEGLRGGAFGDSLSGNAAANGLSGMAGNDSLYAADGFDTLNGGTGNDLLIAGADNDQAFGEDGVDTLFGEGGNDTLVGGQDNDILQGQSGTDVLFGESGHDTLVGGGEADALYGQEGRDWLVGEDGADHLYGGAEDDILIAGFGNDEAFGEYGNDTVFAEAGDDLVVGGAGTDVLYGQEGGDVLFAEDGDDFVYGGTDHDRLYGQGGNDLLQGEAGNDVVDGGAGADFLVGGTGADDLTGGAGADVFYFDNRAEAADRVYDFSHAEGDRLVFQGSAFNIPAGFKLTSGVGLLQGAGVVPVAQTATFYYDTTTKALWYDVDGTGAGGANVIAFLLNTPSLDVSDFVFV